MKSTGNKKDLRILCHPHQESIGRHHKYNTFCPLTQSPPPSNRISPM